MSEIVWRMKKVLQKELTTNMNFKLRHSKTEAKSEA